MDLLDIVRLAGSNVVDGFVSCDVCTVICVSLDCLSVELIFIGFTLVCLRVCIAWAFGKVVEMPFFGSTSGILIAFIFDWAKLDSALLTKVSLFFIVFFGAFVWLSRAFDDKIFVFILSFVDIFVGSGVSLQFG